MVTWYSAEIVVEEDENVTWGREAPPEAPVVDLSAQWSQLMQLRNLEQGRSKAALPEPELSAEEQAR